MNYTIDISDVAENDLDEAYIWYEIQKIDLGNLFLQSVNQAINTISNNPGGFQQVFKNIRRKVTRKFPYVIYYYIIERKSEIKIIAIIHGSRDPKIWQGRT